MSFNPDKQALVHDALNRYETPLLRYARQLLGDLETARDVVQDAFLQLWKQDPDKVRDGLSSWLYAVCRNRALDILRKEQRMTPLEMNDASMAWPHPGPSPAVLAEHKQTNALMRRLIAELPPAQREVMHLKFGQGMSYKEISRITQKSVSNVGFLLHAAVKTIRGHVARQAAAEGGAP